MLFNDSPEGLRYRSLLSQAERMRVNLLLLSRLRTRMERESPGSAEGRILSRHFEIGSHALRTIGTSLAPGEPVSEASGLSTELQTLADELPPNSDARFQMDALSGQLRAAWDLATHATPEGAIAFERREGAKPWRLRLAGRMATLRANVSTDSAAFRHAVRLAACIAVGEMLGRGFEVSRAYWLPMTIAIVLKPDFAGTFSRGVLRLAGTFAGLVFATALFHALPAGLAGQVAAAVVSMFILRCFGPANYGISATAVTALVVILIAMSGVAPKEVIAARGWNTLAGGAIALLAYWLWPTWERTQFSEAMARTLDRYRDYFRAIRESHRELDRTRLAGRLARTNLEASVERLRAEPGISAERALSGWRTL